MKAVVGKKKKERLVRGGVCFHERMGEDGQIPAQPFPYKILKPTKD